MPDRDRDNDAALAAQGDQAAFERLYRVHAPVILGLSRWLVGPDDAEDATQDVFIRAWEKLGTFRQEASFATWLRRLAINVLLRWRERRRRQERLVEGAPPAAAEGGAGQDFEGRITLQRAVERLPEDLRVVFVLHDVEGFDHAEIGRRLGIAPGTSGSRLHRARAALRAALSRGRRADP